MSIEVRKIDGKIDEVVAFNAYVHLEQMDHDSWHLIVEGYTLDPCKAERVDISLFTQGHLRPRIEALEL